MKIVNIKPERWSELEQFLSLGLINNGVYLAGGSLQTMVNPEIDVNDYDLFFRDEGIAKMVDKRLELKGAECTFRCPAGELATYMLDGMKIQLITKFYYSSAEELIHSFDFFASMWAFDGSFVYTTREAVRDSIKEQVRLNDVTFPVATLNRMIKYAARKGFTIPPDTVHDFVMFVNQSEFNEDQMVLYVD